MKSERVMKLSRFLILLTFFLHILIGSETTKKAYEAYLKCNYKKAFYLYQEAAKKDSIKDRIKSLYNIGVFYEKGLGIKKDIKKATKYYKDAAFLTKDIISKISKKKVKLNKKELILYKNIYKALARLEETPQKRRYAFRILKLLENYTPPQKPIPIKKIVQKDLSKEFIKKCKEAKIIEEKDRAGIENLPCYLYKRYPNTTRSYFKTRSKLLKSKDKKQIEILKKRLLSISKPLIKSLKLHIKRCKIKDQNSSKCISELKRAEKFLKDSIK